MRTLYLECNMGAAGDMLMAALLELCPEPEKFLETINGLLPGVRVETEKVTRCGILGTHVEVLIHGEAEQPGQDVGGSDHPHDHDHPHEHTHDGEHAHSHAHPHDHDNPHDHVYENEDQDQDHGHAAPHHHSGMGEIESLIGGFAVSDAVKRHALAVYDLIAQAESHAHGVPVDQIHFHEVGQLDAVMDIVGVCLLMEQLSPDRVLASPVHVGSGQVKTAHGILPVPAPATAHILRGVPTYSRGIRGELCTPTGAALLRYFAEAFVEMPPMTAEKIGCGMGTKMFEAANCVRAFWGESDASSPNDEIAELTCNLDDMAAEAIGYALEQLLANGALDAFVIPIQMKKNRPAQMLTCLCRPEKAAEVARQMLLHTSTIGVRQTLCKRYILQSAFHAVETPYGPVTVKDSTGYGVEKFKPEYEDVSRLAKDHGLPFEVVYRAALKASEKSGSEMPR